MKSPGVTLFFTVQVLNHITIGSHAAAEIVFDKPSLHVSVYRAAAPLFFANQEPKRIRLCFAKV